MTRLEALQAIARGSRGALYFQIRQAPRRRRAPSFGAHPSPRPSRHPGRSRARAARRRPVRPSASCPDTHRIDRRVAVVFDWPSWWAHHNTPGLDQRSRYFDTVRSFHRHPRRARRHDRRGRRRCHVRRVRRGRRSAAAHRRSDVPRTGSPSSSSGAACSSPPAVPAIVGDDGRVHARGVEPVWQQVFGLWVEETDVQPDAIVNRVVFADGTTAEARELFDIVRLDSADVVATFTDDFYAGSPAVTTNAHGIGRAVYLASPSPDLFAAAIEQLAIASGGDPRRRRLLGGDRSVDLRHRCRRVLSQSRHHRSRRRPGRRRVDRPADIRQRRRPNVVPGATSHRGAGDTVMRRIALCRIAAWSNGDGGTETFVGRVDLARSDADGSTVTWALPAGSGSSLSPRHRRDRPPVAPDCRRDRTLTDAPVRWCSLGSARAHAAPSSERFQLKGPAP